MSERLTPDHLAAIRSALAHGAPTNSYVLALLDEVEVLQADLAAARARETAMRGGYLLMWWDTRPDLTVGRCTHVGVWESLADAQAYSEQHGGSGEWDHIVYDGIPMWSRAATFPGQDSRHIIEEIGIMRDVGRPAGGGEGEP